MNHETKGVSSQRGAVLIFSLIMLLLLTLVSVSMIQQNKQELAMAGNALGQTKTLANAETELRLAEQAIDQRRYALANLGDPNPSPNPKCDSSNLINEGDPMGNATVKAVYCLLGTVEKQCIFTGGVRDYSTIDSEQACMCPQLMGTEIYTINLVENSNDSQRTVESKYAVDCSGGEF